MIKFNFNLSLKNKRISIASKFFDSQIMLILSCKNVMWIPCIIKEEVEINGGLKKITAFNWLGLNLSRISSVPPTLNIEVTHLFNGENIFDCKITTCAEIKQLKPTPEINELAIKKFIEDQYKTKVIDIKLEQIKINGTLISLQSDEARILGFVS